MTQKFMKNIGLALWHSLKLELISHTNYSCSFLYLCEDIEFVIWGSKIRYPIFLIEHREHDLVLDQLFLKLDKFSKKYKPGGIFSTITHLQTLLLLVFQI